MLDFISIYITYINPILHKELFMKAIKIITLLVLMSCISTTAFSISLNGFVLKGQYFTDPSVAPVTATVVLGNTLYVLQHNDSLAVYSLSAEGVPEQRLGAVPNNCVDNMFLFNHYLVTTSVVNWYGWKLFDISNGLLPELSYSFCCDIAPHIKIDGNYLYTPTGNDFTNGKFITWDMSDHTNLVPIDYCYPDEGYWEYDFVNRGNVGYVSYYPDSGQPVRILDMSDHSDVQVAGSIPYSGGDMAIYGHNLFMGPSLHIYNINGPYNPVQVSAPSYDYGYIIEFQFVNGLMYTLDISGKIMLCDIGGYDPPESLATATLPHADHSGMLWFPQMSVSGNRAYYAAGDSGLYVIEYTGEMPATPGDANNSGAVNGIDVIFLANYFKGWGPPPDNPLELGDTNGDCIFNGLDETYLVNYLKGGPPPVRGICYTP